MSANVNRGTLENIVTKVSPPVVTGPPPSTPPFSYSYKLRFKTVVVLLVVL